MMRALLSAMMLSVAVAAPAFAAGAEGGATREFHLPPFETFAEVTARPLFTPDRRPREAAPVEAGPAVPLALRGILISSDARYALVEQGTPPAQKRFAEGQSVDAGTIKKIARDHVVLTTPGGTDVIVKLFGQQGAKGNPPPQQAAEMPPVTPLPPPTTAAAKAPAAPPAPAQGQVSRTPLGGQP